jgi:hypothetical protein
MSPAVPEAFTLPPATLILRRSGHLLTAISAIDFRVHLYQRTDALYLPVQQTRGQNLPEARSTLFRRPEYTSATALPKPRPCQYVVLYGHYPLALGAPYIQKVFIERLANLAFKHCRPISLSVSNIRSVPGLFLTPRPTATKDHMFPICKRAALPVSGSQNLLDRGSNSGPAGYLNGNRFIIA